MNPTKTIVDQAEAALRLFFAESREDAARLLEMYGPLVRMFERDLDAAAEVRHLVLDRFPAAEPPSVPGLDWLPAVQADAAVLVAEAVAALDEPKARRWRDRDGQFWQVGDDELISLETDRGPSRLFVLATVEELEELYGPLVEVTP